MQHITGISRHQLRISSLEDAINAENQVRFIDAFVTFIAIDKLGFKSKNLKKEGRPSYQTQVFLKLYLYGYLNGVPDLIAKLQKWNSPYKAKVLLWLKTEYLKLKLDLVFHQTKFAA